MGWKLNGTFENFNGIGTCLMIGKEIGRIREKDIIRT